MNFLFIVQGEGRGHITQAIALYDILIDNGHTISAVLLGKSNLRETPDFIFDKIKYVEFNSEAVGVQLFTAPEREGSRVPILQLQSNTLADQKILLDGSNDVLQWTDVRNKYRAYQGTASYRPSFNLGDGTVTFDGTNHYLSVNLFLFNPKFSCYHTLVN